ncbi:MAG: Rieske 2Fe-2S domain-containing protein [Actinobacteria bacterium]|nr:Rieske 2Fe-2S domain-containing protein [Actinomycetota bacterium]
MTDLHALTTRLEDAEQLDPLSDRMTTVVGSVVKAGPLKDFLSGTWLGHALHPALTDVPLAAGLSATLLDVFGGEESAPAVEKLLALNLLASVPTVAAGWSDWSDSGDEEKRVGIVHAGVNVAALILYGASLGARRRGRKGLGVALGALGTGIASVGGYLGGHLVLAQGVGVDNTVFDAALTEWTAVMKESDVSDGKPALASHEGLDLVVLKRGQQVWALSNRCTHRSGPLNEGDLDGTCIVCPWHGSAFEISDGTVKRGPATIPQPAFEARLRDGKVEVRSAQR